MGTCTGYTGMAFLVGTGEDILGNFVHREQSNPSEDSSAPDAQFGPLLEPLPGLDSGICGFRAHADAPRFIFIFFLSQGCLQLP